MTVHCYKNRGEIPAYVAVCRRTNPAMQRNCLQPYAPGILHVSAGFLKTVGFFRSLTLPHAGNFRRISLFHMPEFSGEKNCKRGSDQDSNQRLLIMNPPLYQCATNTSACKRKSKLVCTQFFERWYPISYPFSPSSTPFFSLYKHIHIHIYTYIYINIYLCIYIHIYIYP